MDYMGNDLRPLLLTGASGYLGTFVLKRLNEIGLQSISVSLSGRGGISCDLTNPFNVKKLIEKYNPSAIIHCAAVVPKTTTDYSNNPAAKSSVDMIQNIVDAAPCKIIFASSMTVYAETKQNPVFEEDVQPPQTGYAYGKYLAEEILLNRQFDGDVAFRLPGLFGLPRRSGLLYNSAKAFLTNENFIVSSPPGIWAAMAVKDAAEYLVRAAQTPILYPAQAINVGYPGEFTMVSAVKKIADICGVEWESPPILEEPFSMCLDRLESRYGLLRMTFEQRLKEFIDDVRMDLKYNY